MSDLERLARAAHEALSQANVTAYLDMPEETANIVVRALLTELREPSEGMVNAGKAAHMLTPPIADISVGVRNAHRSVIDHILEQGV